MGQISFLRAALTGIALLVGCGKTGEEQGSTEESSQRVPASEVTESSTPVMTDVSQSLKAGQYDAAAARLLEMQASGREFTAREAADYRRAMNEAYERALEAAERGDPRAEAAIKMIRAASAR